MTYHLANVDDLPSPALVVFPEAIARNIDAVIALAGSPARLRPHAKTHKTVEIIHMLRLRGVTKHKCATIAEAEMLAIAGVADVLIAYPLVGPNITRLAALKAKYPETHFSSLVDHPTHVDALPVHSAFVIDLDVGQHRTGVSLEKAESLFRRAMHRGLVPFGVQTYDGHNHQESLHERAAAVAAWMAPVLELRTRFPFERIIAGGTPTFPALAAMDVPGLECSPGTFVLHDAGYSQYADLSTITPAAVLVTRVVSRPTATRVTLDLGTKAVASDPPREKRVVLLNVPPYEVVGHNEEYLVVEMNDAERFTPGDVIYALPGHVCPTVALHKDVYVAEQGRIVGTWRVLARDRVLSC